MHIHMFVFEYLQAFIARNKFAQVEARQRSSKHAKNERYVVKAAAMQRLEA